MEHSNIICRRLRMMKGIMLELLRMKGMYFTPSIDGISLCVNYKSISVFKIQRNQDGMEARGT
jgi:hypothetical protein